MAWAKMGTVAKTASSLLGTKLGALLEVLLQLQTLQPRKLRDCVALWRPSSG